MEIPIQAIVTTLYKVTEGPNFNETSMTMLKNCLDSPPYTMVIQVSIIIVMFTLCFITGSFSNETLSVPDLLPLCSFMRLEEKAS